MPPRVRAALLLVLFLPLMGCLESDESTEASTSSSTGGSKAPIDDGFACKSSSYSVTNTDGGPTGLYRLLGCPDGKTYTLECDATTCTCKTDGVATATVPRSGITFVTNETGVGPEEMPLESSVIAACDWP
jgi:hypothetical protein